MITGRTPERPLDRAVKTRLLQGKPVLASIWTNQTEQSEAMGFLSSNIATYETIENGNRLLLTNRWVSADTSLEGAIVGSSDTDHCFYRRGQEN